MLPAQLPAARSLALARSHGRSGDPMTALTGRRRRSTMVAAGAVVVATIAAVALGIVGGLTLYHSTEGADASDDRPTLTFPGTPTALLAAVDDDERLASLAVIVGRPGGRGGSVVTVPVSADASGGNGPDRLPLAETVELTGTDSVHHEVENLLGLTIDAFEVVDRERLEELLDEVGDIEVDLPVDVTNAAGRDVAEAGEQTLDPAAAAAVLTARDPDIAAAEQYPAATAVWNGIADAVGDGLAAGTATGGDGVAGPLGEAMAGPLATRGLAVAPVRGARNPRNVDVVGLDRAELALVFAQTAPGKVSAPNPALTFRVESPFADQDRDGDLSADELVYRVISALLFVRSNVLSVDTTPGEVPATTTIEVADESLLAGVEDSDVFLGDVDVSVADERIVGVDAVVRLGRSYLEFVAENTRNEDGDGE